MSSSKDIYVFEDKHPNNQLLVGVLHVDTVRGQEVFSFEYENGWLKLNDFTIDPNLSLYPGRQFSDPKLNNFGFILDSCPDRWGRQLLDRRELILAKKEKRKPRKLYESDYLLGVNDDSRMGALRFKTDLNGDFVSKSKDLSIPPWSSIRKLEQASIGFESSSLDNSSKWFYQMLSPGSSLGGARPKCSVVDENDNLWIAKFPSKNDNIDVGAWEMVAHDLAIICQLNISPAKIQKFSKYGSTYLTKRFDRGKSKSHRLHFSSAMNMLGHQDGDSNVSYLEIVDFITAYGANPAHDSRELWRRIVFSMCVSNTDDHLRNHGFILSKDGWVLSPMFDINPNVFGNYLSLAVDENDNSINFDTALSASKYYYYEHQEAQAEMNKIQDVVRSNWKRIALKRKIPKSEIDYMSPAFIN